MKHLFSFGLILCSGTTCLAQQAFSAAEQRQIDSSTIAWQHLDDSLEKEWDKTKSLIMSASQLSAGEKEALTNYCAREQYIVTREQASGLPMLMPDPNVPHNRGRKLTDTNPVHSH